VTENMAQGIVRSKNLNLVLVRHAESENNSVFSKYLDTDGWWKFLRSSDPDLSTRGKSQVKYLERYAQSSEEDCAQIMRQAARTGRLKFFASPMRRALKTAQALASGLNFNQVVVHPRMYEEGGCYHAYPPFSEMKGLDALKAMSSEEYGRFKKQHNNPAAYTLYPGLTSKDVCDAALLGEHLDLPASRAAFVKSALPGMDSGWYFNHKSVETRKECFERANEFVRLVQDIAQCDKIDAVVLVSHGDLMDTITKSLLRTAGSSDKTCDYACRFVHCNVAFSRIEVSKDNTAAHVLSLNEIAHVPKSERTGGNVERNGWGGWRSKTWDAHAWPAQASAVPAKRKKMK